MSTKSAYTLPRLQLTAAICFAWLVLFAWFAFDTGRIEAMVFGVCTVFATVAIGLPALLGGISSRNAAKAGPKRLIQRVEDKIQTNTGPLGIRQAAVQILVIPGAVAIGFTAIAIVDMLVRHTA